MNNNDYDNLDENLAWEEISTEHIVNDEWIDFRRSAFRFPDGNVFEPYYSYSRRNYVVIVATDENGNYICVRQFRQGIRQITTEFPAGGIEVKDSSASDGNNVENSDNNLANNLSSNYKVSEDVALEAAIRELREETGYVSDEWRHLITVASNANYAQIFEARNCRKVTGQELDDMEFLNVRTYTADEIKQLVFEEKFQQAIHIMAWLLALGT